MVRRISDDDQTPTNPDLPRNRHERRAIAARQRASIGAAGSVGRDLLWGAAEIAAELAIPERKVFHLLENDMLPARKVGGSWVASRSRLRGFFGGEAAA
jgi:hypothetical protein